MRARIDLAASAAFALLITAARGVHAQADTAAPPLELGRIPTFGSETDAKRGCPSDIVVWADHDTGYFYPRSRPQYGHTSGGAFTCLKSALGADYWDINPFSPFANPKAGREFPIDPALLDWGS